MTARTIVIAEAGVNHNGDLDSARRLIDAAVEAGVDYVKFQTFVAGELASNHASKASYQQNTTSNDESQLEMLRRLELSIEDHQILIQHCRESGIRFFSTAFDAGSAALLAELDLDFSKIPSGEITNLPYLRQTAQIGRPILLSTGMATLGEVETAIEVLESNGSSRREITVLHCNTEYPTPLNHVNLSAMVTMRDALKVNVGYSDHTLGIEVPIAAVALGASVIEKHFTLDRSLPGPDHAASLEPDELKAMVSAIRNIESALGDGIKGPSASELPNRAIARKSIVAAANIKTGETFTEDNLAAKRPGTGLSPMRWDELIGRKADRNYVKDDIIVW